PPGWNLFHDFRPPHRHRRGRGGRRPNYPHLPPELRRQKNRHDRHIQARRPQGRVAALLSAHLTSRPGLTTTPKPSRHKNIPAQSPAPPATLRHNSIQFSQSPPKSPRSSKIQTTPSPPADDC